MRSANTFWDILDFIQHRFFAGSPVFDELRLDGPMICINLVSQMCISKRSIKNTRRACWSRKKVPKFHSSMINYYTPRKSSHACILPVNSDKTTNVSTIILPIKNSFGCYYCSFLRCTLYLTFISSATLVELLFWADQVVVPHVWETARKQTRFRQFFRSNTFCSRIESIQSPDTRSCQVIF